MRRSFLKNRQPTRAAAWSSLLFFMSSIFYTVGSIAESVVSVPITFKTEDIGRILEQQLPTPLYEQPPSERVCIAARTFEVFGKPIPYWPSIRCNISVLVDQDGELTTEVVGSELHFFVPVSGKASLRGVGILGRKIKFDTDIQTVIDVQIAPEISSDWRMDSNLQIEHEWVTPPVLTFMDTVELPLRPLIDPVISQFADDASVHLDKAISDLNVEVAMRKAWSDVQDPIKISDDPEAFLFISPTNLALENPRLTNDALHSVIELKGNVVVVAEAITVNPKTPLPTLDVRPVDPTGISAKVDVLMPYEILADIISKKGQFPLEESIVLDDVEIGRLRVLSPLLSGTPGSVAVSVPGILSAGGVTDTDMTLEMELSLRIDSENQKIKPNVVTAALLVDGDKNSDALFDLLFGHVTDLVQNKIELPYGRYVENALRELEIRDSRTIPLNDQLQISTKVISVDLEKLDLLREHVELSATVIGTASLQTREQ